MNAQPRADLAAYPLDQLHAELEGVKQVQLDFKARQVGIEAEITKRTEGVVKAAIEMSGKTHGVINAPITNSISAKIDISKKVDWDSGKLMAVAQTLPWDRVNAIFKIEFSVPEKIYAGLEAAAPELAKQIEAARTVKYGAPKVTLVMAEEAQ